MSSPRDSFGRLAKRARVSAPQPWSLRLAQLAALPRLARGDEVARRTFEEERLIESLAGGARPEWPVGPGLSERVVEIPWALSRLRDSGQRVLDVGTAFAPAVYQRHLVRLPQHVTAVDLAPVALPRVTHVEADVRTMPFEDRSFDAVACVSTVEHIGMQNEAYGIKSIADGDGDRAALAEIGRVTAESGRILVTVPAGSDADLGWQRQYSVRRFTDVAERAGLTPRRIELFACDRDGWRPCGEDAVRDRTVGDIGPAAGAVICAELGVAPLRSQSA